MNTLRLGGACVNQTPMDWKGNFNNIKNSVKLAEKEGIQFLVFPELSLSAYGLEDWFYSSAVLEKNIELLLKLAELSEKVSFSIGLPVLWKNALYNTSCIIHKKKILGFYAKQNLCSDGVYYESRWFKPWPNSLKEELIIKGESYPIGDIVFELDGIRFGFEICEDAWTGKRPACNLYEEDVDVIINPSASHFAFGKSKLRKHLVIDSSRRFQCAYVYSNLLGNESGRLIFDGDILIAQNGTLLVQNRRFSFKNINVQFADIDLLSLRNRKRKHFSFHPKNTKYTVTDNSRFEKINFSSPYVKQKTFSDFSKEEELYYALCLAMHDYRRKSFSKGFVLSLSGGADSSACALIASHSIELAYKELEKDEFLQKYFLEKDKELKAIAYSYEGFLTKVKAKLLTFAYQASKNSGEDTFYSAKNLAGEMGAVFYDWNIDKSVNEVTSVIESKLNRNLSWDSDDLALQNVQARVRSPYIWMLANIKKALLITTSNRSEAAVGYATMDGDTSGGLAPIAGIDKAYLQKWLQWAEKELKIPALQYVNSLTPTAELRPPGSKQSDEKDLMPYPVLTLIERLAVYEYKSPLEVYKELYQSNRDISRSEWKKYIQRFYRLWSQNQWKRERYAPSFHLDDWNVDPRSYCRFPILNSSFTEELTELEDFIE